MHLEDLLTWHKDPDKAPPAIQDAIEKSASVEISLGTPLDSLLESKQVNQNQTDDQCAAAQKKEAEDKVGGTGIRMAAVACYYKPETQTRATEDPLPISNPTQPSIKPTKNHGKPVPLLKQSTQADSSVDLILKPQIMVSNMPATPPRASCMVLLHTPIGATQTVILIQSTLVAQIHSSQAPPPHQESTPPGQRSMSPTPDPMASSESERDVKLDGDVTDDKGVVSQQRTKRKKKDKEKSSKASEQCEGKCMRESKHVKADPSEKWNLQDVVEEDRKERSERDGIILQAIQKQDEFNQKQAESDHVFRTQLLDVLGHIALS
ncbi:hypothetical protein V5O48_013885 [Marasmius crinis-equi]|uniref:Uncharacterized protein n=1 Tax=Marasmius crinis-equi TaxID=585013 RepID=A0ABR3EZ95_9AGAR